MYEILVYFKYVRYSRHRRYLLHSSFFFVPLKLFLWIQKNISSEIHQRTRFMTIYRRHSIFVFAWRFMKWGNKKGLFPHNQSEFLTREKARIQSGGVVCLLPCFSVEVKFVNMGKISRFCTLIKKGFQPLCLCIGEKKDFEKVSQILNYNNIKQIYFCFANCSNQA